MLFNTIEFAIFFVIVYSIYRTLNHKPQNRFLLFSSYFFYGCWDWRFLGLIFISTVVDYVCGLKIYKENNANTRKNYLILSICTNLGILGFFKYFNFFTDNLESLVNLFGINLDLITLNIILPVGISFYTFQTMTYTIDIYRRQIKPTYDFLDFALFVSYFPQLVAGPIERAKSLLPQIVNKRNVTSGQIREGFTLILWGLFKKVFIADNLAKIVDAVFLKTGLFSGGEALLGVYAFAFQIYGDFSGYSDIARGTSKLMGIDLMVNFKLPYFVTNPRDFWKNWHISLSTWLRDYLYIPLGGNRFGNFELFRNLFLTMLLGGLWHGADWIFLIWGLYQGSILILYRLVEPFVKRIKINNSIVRSFSTALNIVFMFNITCIGWLIFRSKSVDQILNLLNNIIFNFSFNSLLEKHYLMEIIFYTWLLLFTQIIQLRYNNPIVIHKLPPIIRYAMYILIFYMIALWGDFGSNPFIYFRF